MSRKALFSRRTFLRGMGTTMALPLLDAMVPASATAASGSAPRRVAFIFCANGAIMPRWKPTPDGEKLILSETLQPLAKHQQDLLAFSGLTQHHGRANGDGTIPNAIRTASALIESTGLG